MPDSKLPSLYASWTLSASSVSSQGSASESAQRQSRALKAALPVGHTALRRGRGCARKSECGWALRYGHCGLTGTAAVLGMGAGIPEVLPTCCCGELRALVVQTALGAALVLVLRREVWGLSQRTLRAPRVQAVTEG